MTVTELKSSTPVKNNKRKRRQIENQEENLPSTSQSIHDYEDFEDVTYDKNTPSASFQNCLIMFDNSMTMYQNR